MDPKGQHFIILTSLRQGWLSPAQCYQVGGGLKLSSRIGELRDLGYTIEQRWAEQDGKRFCEYRIAPPVVAKPATVIIERYWPAEFYDRLIASAP